jgi:hypothetical protein
MANVGKASTIPALEMADIEEVCRSVSEGKRVTDPELLKRIRQRSEALQREVLEKHGVVDWAVDLIREARNEE